MQSGKAVWPWVLGVVVIGGAGGWLFRDQLKSLADGVSVPVQSTPPVPARRHNRRRPRSPRRHHRRSGIRWIPRPRPTRRCQRWPTAMRGLGRIEPAVPGRGATDPALRDHLIQRLVTQLDNLDKPSVPPTALAARPLPGSLQVEPAEGGERIAASNAALCAYVQAFTALDPAATAAYKRFYPLIQQAHGPGRPDGTSTTAWSR
jgi:hypothetical protein